MYCNSAKYGLRRNNVLCRLVKLAALRADTDPPASGTSLEGRFAVVGLVALVDEILASVKFSICSPKLLPQTW
jgi:hypothetical protein